MIEAKLQRAFPALTDLTPIHHLGEGFGSLVLQANNGLVFRVAKNALVTERYRREYNLLPLLRDQITLQIPFPEYYAEPSEDFPFGVLGYQKIEGATLSPDDVTPATQSKIATQIAQFLVQLHHATLPDLPNEMPTTASIVQMQTITAPYLRAHLSSTEYERLNRWWEETTDFWKIHPAPPTLIHGDAWYENFVIDAQKNVVGVLDFEGLAMDDPAADFVPQRYISAAFANAVIVEYMRAGGKIGDHLDERIRRLTGLRELGGLVYGLQTGAIDKDTLGKIRSTVLINTL